MNKVSLFRKSVLIGLFLMMTIYHATSIFHVPAVNCDSNWLNPIFPCHWFKVVFEVFLWAVVLFLFFLELVWSHDFTRFFEACKSVWPIFLFVLIATLSLIWSILFKVSLYKVFVLLMSTILAIYIGELMNNQRFLDMLVWFFTVLCIVNLGSVWLFPQYSIMPEEFYHRAWKGIFWHRNYLGCFMALGIAVFLLKLLDWKKISGFSKIMNSSMILAVIFLLVKSKSATGIITAIILVAFCLIVAAWLRWGKHLRSVHYYILLGTFIIAIVLVFSNLDFIFGLMGRNISLTGRVPMWIYLFQNVISKRPILGYGYGAIWSLEGFREQLNLILGWPNQVMIGDNGFVDIWLHLGILGVVILLGLIMLGLCLDSYVGSSIFFKCELYHLHFRLYH